MIKKTPVILSKSVKGKTGCTLPKLDVPTYSRADAIALIGAAAPAGAYNPILGKLLSSHFAGTPALFKYFFTFNLGIGPI